MFTLDTYPEASLPNYWPPTDICSLEIMVNKGRIWTLLIWTLAVLAEDKLLWIPERFPKPMKNGPERRAPVVSSRKCMLVCHQFHSSLFLHMQTELQPGAGQLQNSLFQPRAGIITKRAFMLWILRYLRFWKKATMAFMKAGKSRVSFSLDGTNTKTDGNGDSDAYFCFLIRSH